MKSITLIIHSFRDLFTLYLPKRKVEESFGFLVHPRNMEDVMRKYPFASYFPKSVVELFLAYIFWPIVVSCVTGVKKKGTNRDVPGWIITIPMTASQMMKNRKRANKQIKRAIKLADKLGAKNVGLGALTASLTRGGLDLVEKNASNIAITNGKLYTAKTVTDITVDGVLALGLHNHSVVVAIVGAAGSIGSASAQILVKKGFRRFKLIDLSDKAERISKITGLMQDINPNIEVESLQTLESLQEADVIITATNRPDALVTTKHLKPGAIIVDDAQPSDIAEDVFKTRNDVLILEGGVVHTDDIMMHFKMGLKHKTDIFSCLAEVVILTYIGESRQSVGEVDKVDFSVLDKFDKYSEELGLRRGEFQNFNKIYSIEDIEVVKNSRKLG